MMKLTLTVLLALLLFPGAELSEKSEAPVNETEILLSQVDPCNDDGIVIKKWMSQGVERAEVYTWYQGKRIGEVAGYTECDEEEREVAIIKSDIGVLVALDDSQ